MHAFAGLGDGQPPARPLASAQAETDRPDLGAAEPQRPLFESLFRQADQDVSFSEHTRARDDKPLVAPDTEDVAAPGGEGDKTSVAPGPGDGDGQQTRRVLHVAAAGRSVTDTVAADGPMVGSHLPSEQAEPVADLPPTEAVPVPARVTGPDRAGQRQEGAGLEPAPLRAGTGPGDVMQGPGRATSKDTRAGDLVPDRTEARPLATPPATVAPQGPPVMYAPRMPTAAAKDVPVVSSARDAVMASQSLTAKADRSGAVVATAVALAHAPRETGESGVLRPPEQVPDIHARGRDAAKGSPLLPGAPHVVDGTKATAPALSPLPVMPEGEALRVVSTVAEDDMLALSGARAPVAYSQGVSLAGPAAPTYLPHHVAMQIATAVGGEAPGSNRVIDLTLNPEELGRVRLSLSHSESGLSVSVLAERPETLELLRRNIDVLAREFLDIGYQSAEFSFGDGNSDAQHDVPAALSATGLPPEDEGDTAYPSATLHLGDRLDIRL